MRRWLPLMILAAAQFVMVLDSSVMNVSISQIVADLDDRHRRPGRDHRLHARDGGVHARGSEARRHLGA